MTLYLLGVLLETSLAIPITQKRQILICDTLVANDRYVTSTAMLTTSAFCSRDAFMQAISYVDTTNCDLISVNLCNSEAVCLCQGGKVISRYFFFCPVPPPHAHVHLVVLPPGHGSSVTDCLGWDAHEAQLRCPDDVSGDIGGWSARRALKPKFY